MTTVTTLPDKDILWSSPLNDHRLRYCWCTTQADPCGRVHVKRGLTCHKQKFPFFSSNAVNMCCTGERCFRINCHCMCVRCRSCVECERQWGAGGIGELLAGHALGTLSPFLLSNATTLHDQSKFMTTETITLSNTPCLVHVDLSMS